ncbi:beta strand repeat-containing protein, partial [Methylobacterium sp. J-090]|uniref:beta strand repeat-containing protein n=1 Tax=Methylobacterium sp. J-090 TaxID=2836666 RepID=UPI001FBA1622
MASVPVWTLAIAEASAACQPGTPTSGQTVTCTDVQSNGFVAPAGVTGLTVNIQSGATIGSQQTSAGTNPSFTNVQVNGTSVVNNAGTISNTAPLNRDNFGVNLAGDRSTLNNTGTITLMAPAGNATTRVYGAYSSAPAGSQYESTTVTNSGTIAVTQNGNGISRGIYAGENIASMAIINSGTISATRNGTGTAPAAAIDSDSSVAALTVTNRAGGQITGTGAGVRAIQGQAQSFTIVNDGAITGPAGGQAIVVYGPGNATLTNNASGVITGDVRFTETDPPSGATFSSRFSTVSNFGTINGSIQYGAGNHTLNNSGVISGDITFSDTGSRRIPIAVGLTPPDPSLNTVNLGTGSRIGGNIIAQGGGFNTLNLTGTGTLTGTVTGFSSLIQTGAGSAWTTASGSVQNLSGSLTVAGGNLTLGAGSTQNVSSITVAGGNLTLGAGSTQTIGDRIQVTGSGAQLTVNNTVTNTAVNLSGSNTSLVNNGTITGTDAARIRFFETRFSAVLSNSSGASFDNVTVTNNGTIAVTENSSFSSRSIYAGGNIASMAITNAGTISATRNGNGNGFATVAAIDSDDGVTALTVTNRAGGQITGTGTGVRAIQGQARAYTIVNDGTITGSAGGQAIVVFGTGNATLANNSSGVITGDVRFIDADPQFFAQANRRNSTTTNAGRITGNIQYGMGNHTLTNTGAIAGNVTFADVATSQNTVNLGTGSSIGGNITAQRLGTNTLNLSGTGTLTNSVTGFTNLNQTGAGSAWTTASSSVQNLSGNLTVAGGDLTLGAGSTQAVGGLIQVTGSGAQLTVNNTVTNKTVNLSGSNTSLVNNGTLTGTGAAGRVNNASTRVYGVLTNSTGADFANVAVTNNGTIAVTENGIGISRGIYAGENIASMAITNNGTISATRNGTGTAAVAAIDSDDDVAALTVTNRAGGQITGTGTGVRAIQGRAQSFTIANAGTITGPAGGQAIVVYGAGNGVLNNAATGVINGDVRFTDTDPQNATTANRRNSTTTNAGRIAGSVQYGMGNHTLTNTGAITGDIAFADVAASRNTVNLGTGSTIGGSIAATGLGINALNLSGTGTLPGNVGGFTTLQQSDGAWTLASGSTQTFSGGATVAGGVLTVNSTLNANTSVGTVGALAGTGSVVGTLTNAGVVAPGSAAAPYGTLTVSGNYVQQASGTLQSAIAADGQAARLVATGTATLAGTASFNAAAGTYLPNTRYTVLSAAGGVNGSFANLTDNGTLPLLVRAIASSDANNAYVTLVQQSFRLMAQTGNQANVARGLDAALASNPQALLVLDRQSAAGIGATLDRVAGQGYASLADPQLRSGRAFSSQLLSRADAATTEPAPTGYPLPQRVYDADMPNRAPVPAPRFVEPGRGYGVWATGYGQFGSVDSTANAAGRSETVAGMAGGIDFHPQVGTV